MTEFGREYGDGLFELCAEEGLDDRVLAELECLKTLFRQQPDFVRLLMNMTLSRDERLKIADSALRGQVHPYVLNFIKILVERGAVSEFADCAEAYRDRYGKAHDIAEADVTTATALSDEQRKALTERLEKMTGQKILLKEHVRPEVVGGVLLELNGKRYDNTVRQRLENIRRVISGTV